MLTIFLPNQIIESHYSMNLQEQRLVFLAMSKLDPNRFVETLLEHHERGWQPYQAEITVQDWLESYPTLSAKNAYRDLCSASEKLMERKIFFPDENIKNDGTLANWLDSCSYIKKENKVVINFTNSIGMRLTVEWAKNNGGYTPAFLPIIGELKSIYNVRLYLMIFRYLQNKKIKAPFFRISLTDLKKTLIVNGKYDRWADFKMNILDKAIADINEKTNITVFVEPKKKGKKITHLEFYPTYGNQQNLLTA